MTTTPLSVVTNTLGGILNISNSERNLLGRMDPSVRKWVESVIQNRDYWAEQYTEETRYLRRNLVDAWKRRDELYARIAALETK